MTENPHGMFPAYPDHTLYDDDDDEARRKGLHLVGCPRCGEHGFDAATRECHACGLGIAS